MISPTFGIRAENDLTQKSARPVGASTMLLLLRIPVSGISRLHDRKV